MKNRVETLKIDLLNYLGFLNSALKFIDELLSARSSNGMGFCGVGMMPINDIGRDV